MSKPRNPRIIPFITSSKNLIAISITTLLALTITACTTSSNNSINGSDAYTVNTNADTTDRNPGDGVCSDQNNQCSLRAAIIESNTKKGPQSITIPALTITLSKTGTDDKAEVGDLVESHTVFVGSRVSTTGFFDQISTRFFHVTNH